MRVCSPAEVRLLVYVSPCWWRVVTDVLLRWTEGDQMKWRLDLLVKGISALSFLRWTRTDGHFSHVETVTSKGGVSYLLTTAFVSQCPSSCRRARCASSRCRSASPTSTWRPSLPGCCAPATRREPSTPAWYSSVFNLKGSEQSRGSQVLVSQGYGLKIILKVFFLYLSARAAAAGSGRQRRTAGVRGGGRRALDAVRPDVLGQRVLQQSAGTRSLQQCDALHPLDPAADLHPHLPERLTAFQQEVMSVSTRLHFLRLHLAHSVGC